VALGFVWSPGSAPSCGAKPRHHAFLKFHYKAARTKVRNR
jgi:hypothetical protein